MSQQPDTAPVPDRQPLDEHTAATTRACAAEQRAKADALSSVLEDIAAYGYPSAEVGVPWETTRGDHLARLADEQPRVA
ncbi:hypothetical protein OG311_40170 (plasmid) [Streptomyces sp. NBC_01343]|uniref:hypothetical protein n=1 Tax=Streptomyces sp. NBC_01343 TaxID=2903832 RepID=UPI002E0FCD16|nr:hypothetical protein OG311_40170 [Streptomyces sp. NBC_01343]